MLPSITLINFEITYIYILYIGYLNNIYVGFMNANWNVTVYISTDDEK